MPSGSSLHGHHVLFRAFDSATNPWVWAWTVARNAGGSPYGIEVLGICRNRSHSYTHPAESESFLCFVIVPAFFRAEGTRSVLCLEQEAFLSFEPSRVGLSPFAPA